MECFPEVKCMVNNGLPGKASRKRPSNVFLRLKNPPKLVQNGVLAVQWSAHVPFSAVIQFDSTKHRIFSPGTPVSSCTNTEPIRDGPFWTSRENSLVMTDRVIQYK